MGFITAARELLPVKFSVGHRCRHSIEGGRPARVITTTDSLLFLPGKWQGEVVSLHRHRRANDLISYVLTGVFDEGVRRIVEKYGTYYSVSYFNVSGRYSGGWCRSPYRRTKMVEGWCTEVGVLFTHSSEILSTCNKYRL